MHIHLSGKYCSCALVALLMATCLTLNAQVKIGHISSTELLSSMPETKTANTEIDAYTKSWQIQYDALSTQYKLRVKDYNLDEKKMADSAKVKLAAEAFAIRQRMEAVERQATDSIERRKEALLKPVIQKANQVIEAIARENGYDYVIDSSSGSVIYINRAKNDLMPAARAKLLIK